jgi:hypothetical protein
MLWYPLVLSIVYSIVLRGPFMVFSLCAKTEHISKALALIHVFFLSFIDVRMQISKLYTIFAVHLPSIWTPLVCSYVNWQIFHYGYSRYFRLCTREKGLVQYMLSTIL